MTGGQMRPRKIVSSFCSVSMPKYYHIFHSWSTCKDSILIHHWSKNIHRETLSWSFLFLKMRQDSFTSHCHASHKPSIIIFYIPALFQLLLSQFSSPSMHPAFLLCPAVVGSADLQMLHLNSFGNQAPASGQVRISVENTIIYALLAVISS